MRPWYCVQTHPRQEDFARKQLERQGFTTFHPSFLIKKPDRHIVVRSLFSNYLFVSFDDTALWPRIKNTHGVQDVLTYQPPGSEYRYPSALGQLAIEQLRGLALSFDEIKREGTGNRRNQQPRQIITEGCYVKVLDGIFKDESYAQRALVKWTENDRARLAMQIFNREVDVEFYLRDLALVA